jgi:tetratricopeptide (TPR) repeat protein
MIRTASVVAIALAAALSAGCPNQSRNDSIEHMNKGAAAYNNKGFENAITEYKEAIRLYPENHSAYYQLGITNMARGNMWKEASEAFGNAVRIKDDDPMYHLWYGVALLEDAINTARVEQAKRQGKKPEEIEPDLKAINFDPALQHLQAATKMNNDLWRAHYSLGRIYRIQDKVQLAAQEFTAAIQADPFEHASYVALADLYRKWDYTDQAIQIASQGQVNVPGANERAEIDFVLGMSYLDKKNLDQAIEAFTKSIEDSGRQNHKALFERGLSLYAKGETKPAKKDLEDYVKTAGPSDEFNKSMANKVIMEIAAKQN